MVARWDFGVGADAAVELGLKADGGEQSGFVPETKKQESRFGCGFGVVQGVSEEGEEVRIGGVL